MRAAWSHKVMEMLRPGLYAVGRIKMDKEKYYGRA